MVVVFADEVCVAAAEQKEPVDLPQLPKEGASAKLDP